MGENKEHDYEKYLAQGAKDLEDGHVEDAVKNFNAALNLEPNCAKAHKLMGDIETTANKNYELAIQHYEKALEIKPDYFRALNNMGLAYRHLGNLKAARECYEKSLKIEENLFAYNNLGNLLIGSNDAEAAIKCYEKALALELKLEKAETKDPFYGGSAYHLGRAYRDIKEYSKAKIYFLKALEMNSSLIHVLSNLGYIYEQEKDYLLAVKFYKEELDKHPETFDYFIGLGRAYFQLGEFEKAVAILEKEYSLFPRRQDISNALRNVYSGLEKVYFWLEDLEGVAKVLEKLIPLSTRQNLEALYCSKVSHCYEKLGDLDRAQEFEKRVEEIVATVEQDKNTKDDANDIYAHIVKWTCKQGFMDVALKYLEKITNPTDLYIEIATAHMEERDYKGAVNFLNNKQNDFFLLASLGRCHIALKQYDKALSCLCEALKTPARQKAEQGYIDYTLFNIYSDLEQVYTLKQDYKNALLFLDRKFNMIKDKENISAFLTVIYLKQAELHKLLGETKKAKKAFNNAASSFASEKEKYYELAKFYYIEKDYEKSREYIATALSKNDDPRVYHVLGLMESALGNADKAIQSYKNALALNPQFAEAHFKLAKLYFEKEDNALALKHLELAAKNSPGMPDIYQKMADVHKALGNLEAAKRCLAKVYLIEYK